MLGLGLHVGFLPANACRVSAAGGGPLGSRKEQPLDNKAHEWLIHNTLVLSLQDVPCRLPFWSTQNGQGRLSHYYPAERLAHLCGCFLCVSPCCWALVVAAYYFLGAMSSESAASVFFFFL